MEIILGLVVLMALFWLGFHLTGALLSMIVWVCVKLPLAIMLFCLGLGLCTTILMIPLGLRVIGFAGKLLF